MDIQKEREAFEQHLTDTGLVEFAGYGFAVDECDEYLHEPTQVAWDSWLIGLNRAKAQAVPENKIEFDGEYIKYPNSYAIHCQFDEDFDCHIFDVYQNEDCVKDGMTQLKQAHLFVFSMSEAQEPAND